MKIISIFCFLLFTHILNAEDLVSNSAVFSSIYERGEWGAKGSSGSGSDPKNAKMYLTFLQDFLSENEITSVVDLGCGDWRIGREINWDGIKYLGIDVVASVIEENNKNFSSPNIAFLKADGIDHSLPKQIFSSVKTCSNTFHTKTSNVS